MLNESTLIAPTPPTDRPAGWVYLMASAVAVGLGFVYASYLVFGPLFSGASTHSSEEIRASLPPYDVSNWHSLAIQAGGRTEPFESACIDKVRHITGSA